jgi:hypothetical protein
MPFQRLTLAIALSFSLVSCAQLGRLAEAAAGGAEASTSRRIEGGGLPPPFFGEWWYIYPESMRQSGSPRAGNCSDVRPFEYRSVNTYVPISVPGGQHGGPSYSPGGWYSWYARCFAHELDRVGAPLAVLIRERNCPFPFTDSAAVRTTSPGEVAAMLDAVPKLDYLIMDLEAVGGGTPDDVERNIREIVRQVRSHHNPRVRNAFIGNYQDWPGARDESGISERQRDRASLGHWGWNRDAMYRRYLNIAMPGAYPYAAYAKHTDPASMREAPTAPNDRAAMLWAMLERVSTAARNLPDGHLLIPWITGYSPYSGKGDGFDAPPPPHSDLEATVRHLRLRGAYSYMVWTPTRRHSGHPAISKDEFVELAMRAWSTLDPLFEQADGPVRVLNLSTEKPSGVQWSGVHAGSRVWVMVSNLGDSDEVRVPLPRIAGLPESTPPVPRGEHRLFRWRTGD